MRVLILYTELAGYVLSSIRRFLKDNSGADILLIHYPVNPEAPFDLEFPKGSKSLEYTPDSKPILINEVMAFKPDVVLCSGWSNKVYLDIVAKLPESVKKVVCFDNQWKGRLRQWINVAISRFYLLRLFTHAWVPGNLQKTYALKLGFAENRVYTGLYPADSDLFSQTGLEKLSQKGKYPRNILCVARYIPQKDLPLLWSAFVTANEKSEQKWKLDCIGFGEGFEARMLHPDIVHHGFKQPAEMKPYLQSAGLFVLPSKVEPWGVAVHEMALAALPLILSDKIGAADMFLREDNGYSFPAGDKAALEKVLLEFMCKSDEALWHMSEKSFAYGMALQSSHWSETLLKIINSQ